MTITDLAPLHPRERTFRPRAYAMTTPTHFEVSYSINPWMDPAIPVDTSLAVTQWERLRRAYLDLGHTVDLVPAQPGLPDMVYAANGGLVAGGVAIAARFRHDERRAEGPAYAAWLADAGVGPVHHLDGINEGEGDFLVVGDRILAGTGFRTDHAAHEQVQRLTGMPVISLELVDPRYYHLDTVIAVLDDETIAYHPDAFSVAAQDTLATLYPDAVIASESDAAVLGLNLVSDGRNVVMTDAAPELAAAIAGAGFSVIEVDLSELLKGGGGVKCCTLELRRTGTPS
ncbi:dimethylargininase [Gordonia rubripertincta]|uniref:N-dimethylarginine dimethylaminohydrolase n=1 Tax=Gordonia rubripertincta TaxID=36822 RepID=A0ABT4N0B4_GORRU|nr:dimethylargininase [Gordonia rubripertincta]MCZ4552692.1 N-dimethylarginine dimethylaminohydrolase [Gordonia rubripertincta]